MRENYAYTRVYSYGLYIADEQQPDSHIEAKAGKRFGQRVDVLHMVIGFSLSRSCCTQINDAVAVQTLLLMYSVVEVTRYSSCGITRLLYVP